MKPPRYVFNRTIASICAGGAVFYARPLTPDPLGALAIAIIYAMAVGFALAALEPRP